MRSIDCELALSLRHDGYRSMKVIGISFYYFRLRKFLMLLLLSERNEEKTTTPGASYRQKESIETGIIRRHKIHYEALPPTCNVYKRLFYNSSLVHRGGGVRG